MVSQYIMKRTLNFQHGGQKQRPWASKYIKEINKDRRRLFGISLTKKMDSDHTIQREQFMLK